MSNQLKAQKLCNEHQLLLPLRIIGIVPSCLAWENILFVCSLIVTISPGKMGGNHHAVRIEERRLTQGSD